MSVKSLSIKLPEALHARLEAASSRTKSSKSQLIRDALESFFANGGHGQTPATSLDVIKDLVGSLDAPGDLSHNKQYLSDFGR